MALPIESCKTGLKPDDKGLRISVDLDAFDTGGGTAGNHNPAGRDLKAGGDQPAEGSIGPAILRDRPNPGFQNGPPIRQVIHALHCIFRGPGRQSHVQQETVRLDGPGHALKTPGRSLKRLGHCQVRGLSSAQGRVEKVVLNQLPDEKDDQQQDNRRNVEPPERGDDLADWPQYWLGQSIQPIPDRADKIVMVIDDIEGEQPGQDGHSDDDPGIKFKGHQDYDDESVHGGSAKAPAVGDCQRVPTRGEPGQEWTGKTFLGFSEAAAWPQAFSVPRVGCRAGGRMARHTTVRSQIDSPPPEP